MKKAIIITGTPGTGKTVITNLLEKEGYSIIEVGKLVKEKKLYDYYDEERESYVVNDKLLNEKLVELLKDYSSSEPLIIDGHVVELPPTYVLHCIVLRCSIRHLRQRLMERNYGSSKIDENVEAEIMEVLLTDMLELYGPENVSVVYSDGTVEETFKQVLSKVKKVSNNTF
jgi:adenylate kinase